MNWTLKQIAIIACIAGLMAAWGAPHMDTWGFWIGAACLGLMASIDKSWRT